MRFIKAALVLLPSLTVQALNCPNPADFNHHFSLPPISFDQKTQQIKQMTVSINNKSKWVMIMHPVMSSPGQMNDQLLNEMLNQLVEVSPTSYKATWLPGEKALDYCIYQSPEFPKLNAFAYYVGHLSNKNTSDDSLLNNPKINQVIETIALLK